MYLSAVGGGNSSISVISPNNRSEIDLMDATELKLPGTQT